jgi:hypothetical protein
MDPRSRIERLPRRWRRLAGIATFFGLPTMYVWSGYWTTTSLAPIVWGPVSFVLVGVTLVGAFVLYRYVRDRADLPGGRLDERERHLRDHAWILAYQVLAAVVVVLVAVVVIPVLGFGQDVHIDGTLATAAALCLGVLLPLLPAATLAWIEPDFPEDA